MLVGTNPGANGAQKYYTKEGLVDPATIKFFSVLDVLLAVGGGMGCVTRFAGAEMLARVRAQDAAVLAILVIGYMGVLLFSANIAYRQAGNNSRVAYYARDVDRGLATEGRDLRSFLGTFERPPKEVFLWVAGYVPNNGPYWSDEDAFLDGQFYSVEFSFGLDLSAFVVRDATIGEAAHFADSIPPEDLRDLREFLAYDHNDLALVQMKREIKWSGMDELATNIKQRIRQCGFSNGLIRVRHTEDESVIVRRNTAWANFMQSRTLQVITALTGVGWFVLKIYMWLRSERVVVRTRYRVDVPIDRYWRLIADKISAHGFEYDGPDEPH